MFLPAERPVGAARKGPIALPPAPLVLTKTPPAVSSA